MLIIVFILPAVLLYFNERVADQRVESRIRFFIGALSGILYCLLVKSVFSQKMIFSTNLLAVIAVASLLLFIIPGVLAPIIDAYFFRTRSNVLNSHFHISYTAGLYSILTPYLVLIAFSSVSSWISAGFPLLVVSFVFLLDYFLRKHSDLYSSSIFSTDKACALAAIVGYAVLAGFVVALWLLAFSAVFYWSATIALAVSVASLRYFFK